MENIPLFPLHTVLYPDGRMPLRIFEPRYVDMVSECMKTSRGFGVCLIKHGSETGPAATCFDIGTYAEIIDFSRQPDGLLTITIEGKRRFRVLQTALRRNNLLTGEIAWVSAEQAGETSEEYASLRELYLHIVDHFETLYAHENHASVSPALLSYRLAEFLPLANGAKQEVLETNDTGERLALIKDGLISLEAEIESATAGTQ